MSDSKIQQREAIARWIDKRDTAGVEFLLGLCALIVAWRVTDTYRGATVAPMTMSALLQLSAGWWWWLLVLEGVLTLTALVYGLSTGNTYRVRSYVAILGSIVWSAVALAVLTSPGPLSVAAGYILLALMSWWAFLVLMVRAEIKEKAEKIRRQQERLNWLAVNGKGF